MLFVPVCFKSSTIVTNIANVHAFGRCAVVVAQGVGQGELEQELLQVANKATPIPPAAAAQKRIAQEAAKLARNVCTPMKVAAKKAKGVPKSIACSKPTKVAKNRAVASPQRLRQQRAARWWRLR